MKKLFYILLLTGYSLYSQNIKPLTSNIPSSQEIIDVETAFEPPSNLQIDTTKFYIKHVTDQMTDKRYFFSSVGLICSEGKIGFMVNPFFQEKRGRVVYASLFVKSVGIGNCVENSELIFLFEDGSKLSANAWSDFNCEGKSYFDYQGVLLDKIAKPLKAIRFTDGRSFESYTHSVSEADKNYFVDVKVAVDYELILDKGFVE